MGGIQLSFKTEMTNRNLRQLVLDCIDSLGVVESITVTAKSDSNTNLESVSFITRREAAKTIRFARMEISAGNKKIESIRKKASRDPDYFSRYTSEMEVIHDIEKELVLPSKYLERMEERLKAMEIGEESRIKDEPYLAPNSRTMIVEIKKMVSSDPRAREFSVDAILPVEDYSVINYPMKYRSGTARSLDIEIRSNEISFFVFVKPSSKKEEEAMKHYCDIAEKIAIKVNPDLAFFEHEYGTIFFEYFANPYYFASCTSHSSGAFNLSLDDPLVLAEIREAKRLMQKAELLQIINQVVPKTILTPEGLGVWIATPYPVKIHLSKLDAAKKINSYYFTLPQTVTPYYFVRRELRKRGAKLFFGTTESDLMTELIRFPNNIAKAGLISKETVAKLEENAKKLREKVGAAPTREECERLVLEVLTQQKIHELGLDLPRPPKEMMK